MSREALTAIDDYSWSAAEAKHLIELNRRQESFHGEYVGIGLEDVREVHN
jgi:hypothetical protein